MNTINGEYAIVADPARKLIRISFMGFWGADTMARFVTDEQAAVSSLGCEVGSHLVLADVSGAMLQSQDVVAAFHRFIAEAKFKAARLAFVTGNAALRMQARRLLLRPGMTVVATIAEAEAFLFAPGLSSNTKAA